jgi:hypothetical protein
MTERVADLKRPNFISPTLIYLNFPRFPNCDDVVLIDDLLLVASV